jgi:hypothetical protein
MSILGQVGSNANQARGQRIVIAGQEKAGKTTLAMGAPMPLLIPLETDNVALARYPRNHVPPHLVGNWQGVLALCDELRAASMAGKLQRGSSLIWDSATALERINHAEVINISPEAAKFRAAKVEPKGLTMEIAHEGYGKAYAVANRMFEDWVRRMDELASYGGINIIVTCHVFANRVSDPSAGEYDVWDLLLHSPKNAKTYGKREYLTQWADLLGFLHEPIFVVDAEKGRQLSRGISANQGRVLAVDRSPAWVAGNRYGLSGTLQIPPPPPQGPPNGGWNTLAHAIHGSTGGAIDVFNREGK